MIWVSWRQHRGQAMACLAVLAGLAIYAIMVGTSMRTAFGKDGLAPCLAGSQGTGCQDAISTFTNEFGSEVNIAFWSVCLIVPGLIGVLVGAPLVARELEYGTWRLAWSQTVPRSRWLATKLALVTGGLVVLGAAMTAVITWYRAPMDRLTGRFLHNIYDFEGVVLTTYILCAFGFAVLAGLLIRRSIPAMIAAFVPWLAIRLVVEFVFRPHFETPAAIACGATPGGCFGRGSGGTGISAIPPATGHVGDWVLNTGSGPSGNLITYQPADRFWTFQFIEAGIFVALTAIALGATIWLLHRRAAWAALPSPPSRPAPRGPRPGPTPCPHPTPRPKFHHKVGAGSRNRITDVQWQGLCPRRLVSAAGRGEMSSYVRHSCGRAGSCVDLASFKEAKSTP
jgi:hypothetical protein